MTTAETAQAQLDAGVALINEVLGNVETEVAALKANAPASLDFSGLEAAVARGQAATDAVEGEVAAPVEPVEPPVDVPVEPPVDVPVEPPVV